MNNAGRGRARRATPGVCVANLPVEKFVSGKDVEIAGWRNGGSNGEFFSTSGPTIRYIDDAGEWKDGSNFGRHDLLDLAEAAREAATRIRDLQKGKSHSR